MSDGTPGSRTHPTPSISQGSSAAVSRNESKMSPRQSQQINPGLPGLEGVNFQPKDEEPPPEEPEENAEELEVIMKKSQSSEEHLCANFGNGTTVDLSRIPAGVRLNAVRKTRLDQIQDAIPKPKGYVPDKQMPGWLEYPISKTLPTVPAPKDYLYYSRGLLGEKLHRSNLHYTVYDPNNQELVVSIPYSFLHDHNALDFYKKPKIHKQLVTHELVSKTNKPICSMKEFNKFRQYLFKRIYVEDVKDVIHDKDAHETALRNMVLDAKQDKEKTAGKIFRRNERAKAAADKRRQDLVNRILLGMDKRKASEQHAMQILNEKQYILEERKAFKNEQERIQRSNVDKMERERINKRAVLMKNIAAADKAITDRRVHDKELIKRAHRQFQLEWMNAKWDYQKIMASKQKFVNNTVDYNTTVKAQIRQDKVEALRAHMPQIIAKRKAEEQRLWDIVRKYFNRWRDNVRKRKERRPDAMHKSNWDILESMDKTVKYLREESGYEKLDDFIMGIVALKKRIKAELDAEEAAEAAAFADGSNINSRVGSGSVLGVQSVVSPSRQTIASATSAKKTTRFSSRHIRP